MSRRNTLKQLEAWRAQNLQAALLIIARADEYGGEEALAVRWARAVVSIQQPAATTEWELVA